MPTYCYTSKQGETVERYYRLGNQPRRIRVRGVTFNRDVVADQRGFVDTPATTGAFECLALSVHPRQVKQATADAAAKGLKGFRFLKDGTLMFDSHRKPYREYCLAYGVAHNNAGYSEPTYEDTRRYRERRGEPPRE